MALKTLFLWITYLPMVKPFWDDYTFFRLSLFLRVLGFILFQQRQRTKSRTLKDLHEAKLKNTDKAMKKEKKHMKLDPVILYDVHCLLNIHRQLAENYL